MQNLFLLIQTTVVSSSSSCSLDNPDGFWLTQQLSEAVIVEFLELASFLREEGVNLSLNLLDVPDGS